MKEFLSLAKERRTVYEFSSKEISQKDLAVIIECGRWAPSFSNSQPWRFVVVKDREKILKIMSSIFYGAFHSPPTIIVLIVLPGEKIDEEIRGMARGKVGLTEAYLSLGCAATQMSLAATDLKIGSAILTPEKSFFEKEIGLKKKDLVPIVLALGYEDKKAFKKKRSREEIGKIALQERYGAN